MNESNKKNYWTLFFLFTTILLAIFLIMNRFNNGKSEKYSSSVVLNKVVHIQELALVKHNYNGVIGYNEFLKFLNINVPLTEKHFLLKYNGYIKAGVNFSKIVVSVNGNAVHVIMPKAEILDVVIDENSLHIYNESDNAFNPIRISDYNDALKKEKETMRNNALSQGILRDANQQAKLVITALLQEMGFKEITVTEEIKLPTLN